MSYTERFTALCHAGHDATWHVTSDHPEPRVECVECEPAPVTPAPVVLEPGTSWAWIRGGRRGVA